MLFLSDRGERLQVGSVVEEVHIDKVDGAAIELPACVTVALPGACHLHGRSEAKGWKVGLREGGIAARAAGNCQPYVGEERCWKAISPVPSRGALFSVVENDVVAGLVPLRRC